MGSGKTTIGKALAKELGVTFYDLDWYIEDRYHKTVSEIFTEKGEQGFREVEQRMLREVAEFENVVISAGGGTPCFFDNIHYMNKQAKTVYLKASPTTLFGHLKAGKSDRPLIKGKTDDELLNFITNSLEKREPYYEKACYLHNVDQLETYEKINESVTLLRKLLNI